MADRRTFLRTGALTGAGLLLPWKKLVRKAYAQFATPGLPGGDIMGKFTLPLIKPPAMPLTRTLRSRGQLIDYYEIAVRQFSQRILPNPHPTTTVWSYGSVQNPATFNYPAFTIESSYNRPVRVKWINQLVDNRGRYLPHLLPVDPTLHWANPPGGLTGRDTRPDFMGQPTPGPYTGPVPIVTHVHGAHTTQDSDGYPEAWYLPNAKDIPAGYARTGTYYDKFKSLTGLGNQWSPDAAVFQYPNDQRATTLWYHDHTLGMTRLNVYAGPAGFFLIRGGSADLNLGYVAPGIGDDPFGEYTEIPIAIQDRSFNLDGSLFYPDSREFFDGVGPLYIPDTDVSPIWNPEFFGDAMVVNGRAWPFVDVEKRRYRLRLLNGCNSRFLILDFNQIPGVKVWQIGAEGGFLRSPVDLTTTNDNTLLMAPAERADLIVDFTGVTVGNHILKNVGPDEPFKGFNPDGTLADGEGGELTAADGATTGQVMMFKVKAATSPDTTTDPAVLALPAFANLSGDAPVPLSLNEEMSMDYTDAPVAALLGTYDPDTDTATTKLWMDPVTENPLTGQTQVWAFHNFTADAHPIHIHQVQFQVVGRGMDGTQPPEPWEDGFKDTVIAYPGEITRVRARFDIPGQFVWHCHIVEHEDNEMMRPFRVG